MRTLKAIIVSTALLSSMALPAQAQGFDFRAVAPDPTSQTVRLILITARRDSGNDTLPDLFTLTNCRKAAASLLNMNHNPWAYGICFDIETTRSESIHAQ